MERPPFFLYGIFLLCPLDNILSRHINLDITTVKADLLGYFWCNTSEAATANQTAAPGLSQAFVDYEFHKISI